VLRGEQGEVLSWLACMLVVALRNRGSEWEWKELGGTLLFQHTLTLQAVLEWPSMCYALVDGGKVHGAWTRSRLSLWLPDANIG
jgi:hypothetical protein